MSLAEICLFGFYIILIAIFLWIISKIAKFFWNRGEKKTNVTGNETSKNSKSHGNKMLLVESDSDHRLYEWKNYEIVIGDDNFMKRLGKIPFSGVLVTKEDDFAVFKRVKDINISEDRIKKIVSNSLQNGEYDLIMAWKESVEVACGGAEYLKESYGFKYGGMVLQEGRFIRLFDHDCRNLTKEKMVGFVKENVNKNEVAIMVVMPEYIILSLSEKVSEKIHRIPRDLFIVLFPEDEFSYIYDMPFKIRSEYELIELAEELLELHAEEGVTTTLSDITIFAFKAKIANSMIPNAPEGEITKDVIYIYKESWENPIVAPVKWRAWTKDDLVWAAEKIISLE